MISRTVPVRADSSQAASTRRLCRPRLALTSQTVASRAWLAGIMVSGMARHRAMPPEPDTPHVTCLAVSVLMSLIPFVIAP